jgi:hypothetical protein
VFVIVNQCFGFTPEAKLLMGLEPSPTIVCTVMPAGRQVVGFPAAEVWVAWLVGALPPKILPKKPNIAVMTQITNQSTRPTTMSAIILRAQN